MNVRQHTTLCFPVIGSPPTKVLLGVKKRGRGLGKYFGFGGHVEADETIVEAALRELHEESMLVAAAADLHYRGHVTFLPNWSQAHVFVLETWQGEPCETAEMKPLWVTLDEIPFHQMWPKDRDWLLPILAGHQVQATVVTQEDGKRSCQVQLLSIAHKEAR